MKAQHSLKKSSVKAPAERVIKDIRRATRRHFSAEDKIRIVLDGLRGDDSIAELCRKEGIAQHLLKDLPANHSVKKLGLRLESNLVNSMSTWTKSLPFGRVKPE